MISDRSWWRNAVIYQLYLRSFNDSDADGIGDLPGVLERLDHIADLGVDAVWLNPCYPSPGNDGGYDISDYTAIDPAYGSLTDFDKLLAACHERGLRLLMDLVPNHCSDQHAWFQAAQHAEPGSLERGRFHFRDGRGPGGTEPPNNWRSTFGGPAWTRTTDPDGSPGQWYLHCFDSTQPDLNWDNPEVREYFDHVLRFWIDRGVDGFRIDVAYAMVKHPDLPDLDDPADNPYAWNQAGVHEIHSRWRQVLAATGRDIPLIGEVWLPAVEASNYIRPGQLDEVFYFDLLLASWDADAWRTVIDGVVSTVPPGGGVPAWVLNNHDVHRAVTRYGVTRADPIDTDDANARITRRRGTVDIDLGRRRAQAALLIQLALPGSAYLYQGEELGLPEVLDLPADARRDPIWNRSEGREHGRDGSRVPLPWTPREPNLGFSSAERTWLPQPAWFAGYAAQTQERSNRSMLCFYRRALAARRHFNAANDFSWTETRGDGVLQFRRGQTVVTANFGRTPVAMPPGRLIIRSGSDSSGRLEADDVAWTVPSTA